MQGLVISSRSIPLFALFFFFFSNSSLKFFLNCESTTENEIELSIYSLLNILGKASRLFLTLALHEHMQSFTRCINAAVFMSAEYELM